MPGPIYKLFRVRWAEAYYQLSPAEKEAMIEKIDQIGRDAGLKRHVLCDSSWSNEQWTGFGVD